MGGVFGDFDSADGDVPARIPAPVSAGENAEVAPEDELRPRAEKAWPSEGARLPAALRRTAARPPWPAQPDLNRHASDVNLYVLCQEAGIIRAPRVPNSVKPLTLPRASWSQSLLESIAGATNWCRPRTN